GYQSCQDASQVKQELPRCINDSPRTQKQFNIHRPVIHKNRIEVTYHLSLALMAVLGIAATVIAVSQKHRDVALWLGFAAALCGVLSFFAWLQDYLWKQDTASAKSTT